MNKATGWILDTYIQDNEAIIWFHTEDRKVLRLTDAYSPSFYVLPRSEEGKRKLYRRLQDALHVKSVVSEEKYTTLGEERKKSLLCVTIDSAFNYKELVRSIELLPDVKALYNTDLLQIQQYLFTKLNVAPTSKVEIEYNQKKAFYSIKLLDDAKKISPPPFTFFLFDMHTDASILSPNPQHDPLTHIKTKYSCNEILLRGEEADIIEQWASLVKTCNPDFLVCPDSRNTVNYLFDRVMRLKLNLQLGREQVDVENLTNPLPYWFRGRVVLDYNYFKDYGIAGLVERARFSFLPPGIASRWTANRIIDSRNCYELLKRSYVIPKNEGYYEYIRTIMDVVENDRGGLIIAPKIGVVHENIAELDFESQYPNLIVKDCLSYETVTPEGLTKRKDALLPSVTKHFLTRRLWFKRLRKKYNKNSQEWLWCEQRQLALKMILVCLYGTAGCCWNRFGNVLCFEEINKRSRRALVKTKDLVQREGFEVVYADTDSIFVKKTGATKKDYKQLSREISRRVGLPITLDHHYKFLLLLPLKTDPTGNMEAQKRYFGVLSNGELLARGIEVRRHDSPRLIKNFQPQLIQTLFNVENAEEVYTTGYKNAVNFVAETINRIMKNNIPIEELVVSKTLRKPLYKYKSMFPHVSAAIHLSQKGKVMRKGDIIDFVFVNAKHHNPFRRVAPIKIYNSDYFDREKYRDMILDATETVLATFGFSKQKVGLDQSKRAVFKGLLRQLIEDKTIEKETEERI